MQRLNNCMVQFEEHSRSTLDYPVAVETIYPQFCKGQVPQPPSIMKILQTQTLRGPNYWSICHPKLILVRLDLETLADRPTDSLPGFYDGLVAALPSLEEHSCSLGCRGGFLSRVREGTMMGHILEHVALEFQSLADMPVGFGRTHETSEIGIYRIVIEYQVEAAGRYATRAALRLCQSIVETGTYPKRELKKDLDDLVRLRDRVALGATTDILVQEAEHRGIPWTHLETCDLFQLGYGKNQKRVQAALTSRSSVLGVELSCDKQHTKKILERMGVPVPLGVVIYAFRELRHAIARLGGYPIVIKPLDGNHGRGITINIQSWEQAEVAYDRAREVSSGVIVEHYYQGRDHRILVVNHKVVAVAERVPAHVVGNGVDTISALVELENQDYRRGEGHDNMLTYIHLDDATDEMLHRQGCTLETILPAEEICYLRATANLSTGGIAIDRTDEIHPDTVWLAERVSRIIDLDIAGIDVITTDITKPLSEVEGVIVEVNAAPGLRMHVSPSQGVGRNVAAPILNMLFPPGTPIRIPIVAVTGSNINATPTLLIAHIFSQVYEAVGFTATDHVFIGNHRLEQVAATGLPSAQMILQDPTVDIAVLETTQEEILNSGLAFSACDVGVVMNVAADRLGLKGSERVHRMARVNGVVAEMVRPDGYAVLNADDAQVTAMVGQVLGKVAYFSMDAENPWVRSHVQRGGIAAIYAQGNLLILQADRVHQIEHVARIPALGGCTPFLIANALAACLTAFVLGVNLEQIRAALHSFDASAQQTSGQMHLFNLDYDCPDVLQQYADLADFKDEQVMIPDALSLQPALLRPRALDPWAMVLENGLRHEMYNSAIQAHSLNATVRAAEFNLSVEICLPKQSVNGHHRLEVQARPDRNGKATTAASVLTEDRPFDVQRGETTSVAPAHRLNSAVNPEVETPQRQEIVPQHGPDRRQQQAPGWKKIVFNVAQNMTAQALNVGEIIGTVAISWGRVAAAPILEKVKVLGAIAWEKFEQATQLVDPMTLDPVLQEAMHRWGQNGRWEDERFIFQQVQGSVDVFLKDGTPLYTNGKLNPKMDGRFSFFLSKIPETMAKFKADMGQQPMAQDF
jgi:cyanophycin synthetase